jgi:hypothetical protein
VKVGNLSQQALRDLMGGGGPKPKQPAVPAGRRSRQEDVSDLHQPAKHPHVSAAQPNSLPQLSGVDTRQPQGGLSIDERQLLHSIASSGATANNASAPTGHAAKARPQRGMQGPATAPMPFVPVPAKPSKILVSTAGQLFDNPPAASILNVPSVPSAKKAAPPVDACADVREQEDNLHALLKARKSLRAKVQ